MSSRGRRYEERKLNKKKVLAVILAVIVIVMFVIIFTNMIKENGEVAEKVSSIVAYYTNYDESTNKWGVIDSNGNTILAPKYDEMVMIPNNKKKIFVVTENVDYINNTYTSKAINENGNEIATGYDKIEAITNYDSTNSMWIVDNLLKTQKEGKYGLIDLSGNQMLPPNYDLISVLPGVKSVLLVERDEFFGLVDNIGNFIVDPVYKEVKALTTDYSDGFVVKGDNDKYGIITTDKTLVLATEYDEFKPVKGNGLYVVKKDDTWKVVNTAGEVYLDGKFDDVKSINSENVVYKTGDKWGILNIHGTQVIEPTYEDLTYAFQTYYIAKRGGKYGIIGNSKEEKLGFNYSSISYNKEGGFLIANKEDFTSDILDMNFNIKLNGIVSEINKSGSYIKLKVNGDYKYYNFALEEKTNIELLKENTLFLKKENGKYGYVNSKGVVIVNYIYDDATEQNQYGYAAVKKDGKWGAINSVGNVIVEPKLTLENNLVIDFIGTYHLAPDLNANYYIK